MTDPAPPPAWTPEQEQALHDLIAAKEAAAKVRAENAKTHVEAKFAPLRAIVGTEDWKAMLAGLEAGAVNVGLALQADISRFLTIANALSNGLEKAEQAEFANATAVVDEAFPPAP